MNNALCNSIIFFGIICALKTENLHSGSYFTDYEYSEIANVYLKRIVVPGLHLETVTLLQDFIKKQLHYYALQKNKNIEEMQDLQSPEKLQQQLRPYLVNGIPLQQKDADFKQQLYSCEALYLSFEALFVQRWLDEIRIIFGESENNVSSRNRAFLQNLRSRNIKDKSALREFLSDLILEEKIRCGHEVLKNLSRLASIITEVTGQKLNTNASQAQPSSYFSCAII